MARLRSSHANILKVTQAAIGPFAKQLYKELARAGKKWIAAVRKDESVSGILPEHQTNVIQIIRKNAVRIMRAMHTYQMKILDIDASELLYKRSRQQIPILAASLSGDPRFIDATEQVLTKGYDLLPQGKDEAIQYVKERTVGGIGQRRTKLLAEDLAHMAAQNLINNIGEEDSNILAAILKGVALGAAVGAAVDRINQAKQEQIAQKTVKEARDSVAKGTKGATIEPVGLAAGEVRTAGMEKPSTKLMKMWMSRRDNKVRPTHRVADGQTINMNETFTVGGYQAKYPGDPSLPYKERMNCRCVIKLVKRKIK